jgi:hypothetical protein
MVEISLLTLQLYVQLMRRHPVEKISDGAEPSAQPRFKKGRTAMEEDRHFLCGVLWHAAPESQLPQGNPVSQAMLITPSG